ncbi:MAG: T9SS type A sorting domain-containing protein [Chitinophagaceae bacterium]|nr:T9SS type A sorting domain-containing protein [Chitinophagaceae bacterium]
MKILSAFLVIVSIAGNLSAQTTESISMSPGYANEVFWKMQGGVTGQAAINSWELAFRLGLQNSSIFINSANGVNLYHVPNTDTTGWLTLDTTGLQSWQQLYNSDTSWEYGAFDRSSTGFPDFSWGDYDFTTHVVTGDSLYVIKTGSVFKKLWIMKKDFGNWTFRYANLDNTGDQTIIINDADYPNKNFAYYSITNGTPLNLEPDNTNWDILFTRYVTLLPPDNTPYLVTGVLNNVGVTVAQANNVDVNTVNASAYDNAYTASISEIGYDWKFFDMASGQYALVDSLCYFVKSLDGNIYKLVFTGFAGSATGDISWEQSNSITSVNNLNYSIGSATIYPNPVNEKMNLIFDAKKAISNLQVSLNDVNGREVYHTTLNANSGLNQRQLSLPAISDGLYILLLDAGNEVSALKVMVAQ